MQPSLQQSGSCCVTHLPDSSNQPGLCLQAGCQAHCLAASAGVETSSEAVQLAEANASLNEVQASVEFCRQDVADYMREARAQGRTWDLVVLDPPKLAPNKKVLLSCASEHA